MKLNSKSCCVYVEKAGKLEQWVLEMWSKRVPWVQWMCPALQTWKQRCKFAQMDYWNWRFPSALVSAHSPQPMSAQVFLCQVPIWRHSFGPVPVICVLCFNRKYYCPPQSTLHHLEHLRDCVGMVSIYWARIRAQLQEKKNLECEVVRYIVGMGTL